MPGTVEAALVLIVLAGPGFIASRFLNGLVAYRTPTAFRETTQAVVLSAVLVSVWLLGAVTDDLPARQVESVWIDVGSEVGRVDVFAS
jgi:hypothetical protein